MSGINRPDWINAHEYTQTLNTQPVQEPIAQELSKKYDPTKHDGLRKGTAYNDAKYFLPLIMDDLRYFDIKSRPYWLVSLCGSILFFLTEAIILFLFSYSKNKSIILLCFLLSVSVILCLIALVFMSSERPKYVRKIGISTFYIIPVALISLGLLAINLLLVADSGWSDSPFMPALIFVSLSIIGAPRENSKTIYCLTLFAALAVACPYYFSSLENGNTTVFHSSQLSIWINIATFVFTTAMILLLRSHSSEKIKQENKICQK